MIRPPRVTEDQLREESDSDRLAFVYLEYNIQDTRFFEDFVKFYENAFTVFT